MRLSELRLFRKKERARTGTRSIFRPWEPRAMIIGRKMRVFRGGDRKPGSLTFPNFYSLPLTTDDSTPGSKIIVIELPHAVIQSYVVVCWSKAEVKPNFLRKVLRKLRSGVEKVSGEQRKFIENFRFTSRTRNIDSALSHKCIQWQLFKFAYFELEIVYLAVSSCRFALRHWTTRFWCVH